MTSNQFQMIMTRLDEIESKIDYQDDPAKHISVCEKAEILRKAIATGDKKKVRAAAKMINGK